MTARRLVTFLLLAALALPCAGCAELAPRDGTMQVMYARQHNLITGRADRDTTGVGASLRWDFRTRRQARSDDE